MAGADEAELLNFSFELVSAMRSMVEQGEWLMFVGCLGWGIMGVGVDEGGRVWVGQDE
jgi:hypothetical protein